MNSKNVISFTNKVVRKKSERKQLEAFDCEECYNYYKCLNLSDDEIKNRIQKCSRHRSNTVTTKETDHYWDIDFPIEEEKTKKKFQNKKNKKKIRGNKNS